MGLQAISWQAYWLDTAWTRPGKEHAFVRGVGHTADRALCGYEPAWDCNTMYGYQSRCKRCEQKVEKLDMHECA